MSKHGCLSGTLLLPKCSRVLASVYLAMAMPTNGEGRYLPFDFAALEVADRSKLGIHLSWASRRILDSRQTASKGKGVKKNIGCRILKIAYFCCCEALLNAYTLERGYVMFLHVNEQQTYVYMCKSVWTRTQPIYSDADAYSYNADVQRHVIRAWRCTIREWWCLEAYNTYMVMPKGIQYVNDDVQKYIMRIWRRPKAYNT
jgi:hypothetical protein